MDEYGPEEAGRGGEEDEREYSFDLEFSNDFYDPYKLHAALFQICRVNIPPTDEEVPIHRSEGAIDQSVLIRERQGVYMDRFERDRLQKLFTSICAMCDPYTQPWDVSEMNVLSLEYVADVVIGATATLYADNCASEGFSVPHFDMAFDVASIAEKILHVLRADDENTLQSVRNDDVNWENDLGKWLPLNALSSMVHIASDFHHLMLLYTMVVVCFLIIHKLYQQSSNNNVCLNPFLRLYLQVWKNMTRVIFLGIEIDRRDEEHNFPGYPEVIRYMIKGSSAVRSVISLILNDDFKKRTHDLRHEPLLNFMHPYGRKFRDGSIKTDMRVFVAALLALGSDLEDVIELLFNFEPEDEYDEDIKYMFEMELENMEEFERIDTTNGKSVGEDEYHKRHSERINQYLGIERDDNTPIVRSIRSWEVHPECECVFDSDEELESLYDPTKDPMVEGEEQSEIDLFTSPPTGNQEQEQEWRSGYARQIERQVGLVEDVHKARVDFTDGLYAIRNSASKRFEVDADGKDWRDMPRGSNQTLTTDFIELLKKSQTDPNVFITPMTSLLEALATLTVDTQPAEFCEKVIRSVAWVVRYEFEATGMTENERDTNSDPSINTDTIYEFLKYENNFDLMVKCNPSATFSIVDELMMVEGYKRVLIWFLTHSSLNQWLINYFYELLAGLRGNPPSEETGTIGLRYSFSRVGALALSEMEVSMLLHEFFSNAVIYLSRGSSFEFEDLVSGDQKTDLTANDESTFITNRSNAQKLIKVICLVLKSLQSKNILKVNDPEYRVEIQTLLMQWVGASSVPEAKELFTQASVVDPNFEPPQRLAPPDEDPSLGQESVNALNTKLVQQTDPPAPVSTTLAPFQQKLKKMEGLKLYRLFQHTLSVDTLELLTTILHLGAHYELKKDEIISFTKDLNSVEKVYPDKDMTSICELVFTSIGSAIDSGKEEDVVEIAFASGIVSANASLVWVRKVVNEYMQGEVEFGDADEDSSNEDPNDKKKKTKKKKKKRKT